MFDTIKKWFKKKPQPQPQEQDLFGDDFRNLAKAVIERPKDKPYGDYIKSRLILPSFEPKEFVKSLEFDIEVDIDSKNLALVSNETKKHACGWRERAAKTYSQGDQIDL
jgi:hypothetical protein